MKRKDILTVNETLKKELAINLVLLKIVCGSNGSWHEETN